MILVKCAGTHNVADELTKMRPSGTCLDYASSYLTVTCSEYKAFFACLGITETSAVAWASV